MSAYQKLKNAFQEHSQLQDIQRIMMWDEAVMMPEGAGPDRAKSMAALNCLLQKLLVTKKNKNLLAAASEEDGLSDWDRANLQWMKKKYAVSTTIPARLTEKLTLETLASEQAWRKLRAENNWREYLPIFKRLFKLVKEMAVRRGDVLGLTPYDAMLDEYAPGFNQASIDVILGGLKRDLPGVIDRVMKKQAQDNLKTPRGPFPIAKQKEIGLRVMKAMGFNFQEGRLDVSHHPFCGGNQTDVRITTRYNEDEFISSLTGVCHETGHALYEQGLPRDWQGQPVGSVNSMAMHESQSLLMEKQVCGSLEFYQYLTPDFQQAFGMQEAFTPENLHKIATQVEPGFIRVDSDEITYHMHIILRYELEKMLFSGEITVADLPKCWDELMMKYLNLSTKGNYKDGVMQDVHWPIAAFGYFPAYSLGRLIAAQVFATFIKTHPEFFAGVAKGNFAPLVKWLNQHIHSQAAFLPTQDLLVKVTGKTLDPSYFIRLFD